jgi:uncharacterized repeat protein (TIGR03803 family)
MAGPKQRTASIFETNLRAGTSALVLLFMFATAILAMPPAQAQTYTVLHSFSDKGDGGFPYAGVNLIVGNLYGTTSEGGRYGYGTVYELKHRGSSWTLSTLYSFTGGSDGAYPYGRVTAGPGGILYGTTAAGGKGYGTVFTLRMPAIACHTAICPWIETVLYRFQGGSDGAYPGYADDLVFDQAGNIYGTTSGDSSGNDGTVFELSPSNGGWTETILHRFTNGEQPFAGVIFDTAGNLYGTTPNGGAGYGTVYKLTPSGSGWTYSTIYEFQSPSYPIGGVAFDTSGNLYGATISSGSGGYAYELQPSNGGWTFTTIYNNFASNFGAFDTPTLDTAGNVYGTVFTEGPSNYGLVFKLTPSGGGWTETNLKLFGTGNNEGIFPYGSVVLDASGNVYGTTLQGGSDGDGTVWEIMP